MVAGSQNVSTACVRLRDTQQLDIPLLSQTELKKLRQHHHQTIGLFVAFWICAVCAVLAIEFLELSERTTNNLIGALFGAAIVAVLLQFSSRCPRCQANLGWQSRLGIPKGCRQCGVTLRGDHSQRE